MSTEGGIKRGLGSTTTRDSIQRVMTEWWLTHEGGPLEEAGHQRQGKQRKDPHSSGALQRAQDERQGKHKGSVHPRKVTPEEGTRGNAGRRPEESSSLIFFFFSFFTVSLVLLGDMKGRKRIGQVLPRQVQRGKGKATRGRGRRAWRDHLEVYWRGTKSEGKRGRQDPRSTGSTPGARWQRDRAERQSTNRAPS